MGGDIPKVEALRVEDQLIVLLALCEEDRFATSMARFASSP